MLSITTESTQEECTDKPGWIETKNFKYIAIRRFLPRKANGSVQKTFDGNGMLQNKLIIRHSPANQDAAFAREKTLEFFYQEGKIDHLEKRRIRIQ